MISDCENVIITVPFFNEQLYLNDFLICLSKQKVLTKIKWKVLFIDNNSTDKSKELIENFCLLNKIPFEITSEKRQGTVYSRISGLKKANQMGASIIISTDADVFLPTNFITQTVIDLRSNQADVLSGKFSKNKKVEFWKKSLFFEIENTKRIIWNKEYELFGPYFFGGYFAIDSSLFKSMRLINPEKYEAFFGEDIFLSRRAYYMNAKFIRSNIFVSPNPRRDIALSPEEVPKFAGNNTGTHGKQYSLDDLSFKKISNKNLDTTIISLYKNFIYRLIYLAIDAVIFWHKTDRKYVNSYQSFLKTCDFLGLEPIIIESLAMNKNEKTQAKIDNLYCSNEEIMLKALMLYKDSYAKK